MQLEYQLRTEIEFWRDVIETRPPELNDEAFERVQQAKTLAERKLALCLDDSGALPN
jgi:hypothetical protein